MNRHSDTSRLDPVTVGAQVYAQLAASAHSMVRASDGLQGDATVTKLADWKAAHSRPVVIDYCRLNEAIETTMRANMDMAFTLWFVWPRVILRAAMGV